MDAYTFLSPCCKDAKHRVQSLLCVPSHQTLTDVLDLTSSVRRREDVSVPVPLAVEGNRRTVHPQQPHISISSKNDAFSSSSSRPAPLRRCRLDRRCMQATSGRAVDRRRLRTPSRSHQLQKEIHWIHQADKTRQAVHHLHRLTSSPPPRGSTKNAQVPLFSCRRRMASRASCPSKSTHFSLRMTAPCAER